MLKGKTAVITGGSRGIGREIALRLAGAGADIAIIYSGSHDAAEDTRKQAEALGVKAAAYQCPVEDDERVKAVCGEIHTAFGRVDILVNNAGITRDGLMLRMTDEDFRRVLDVNITGAFHFMRNLSRYIMKSDNGRIINVSSVIGLRGNVGQANYAASKAGLIGLTKSAAREFASRGVTCNAIAPGFIETDMTAALSEAALNDFRASIPLGRAGQAREVAALAAFLASPEAGYITGEVIRIDGGMAI